MANIVDVLKYMVGIDVSDLEAGSKKAERTVANMSQSIQGALQGVAAAFGIAFGVHQIKQMVDGLAEFAAGVTLTAARTEVLEVVLKRIGATAGYSAKYLKEQEDAIKAVGITTQVARNILIRFMQAQLEVADAIKIAKAAQDLAVIAGMNTADAANQLADAIAMQRPILLKQFGILAELNDIYTNQAKALKKTVEELTEYDKRQGFLNAILDQAARVQGSYNAAMEMAGKKLTSLPRYAEEAANAIGNIFLPMFGQMVDDMTQGFKDIENAAEGNSEEVKHWQDTMVLLYQPVRLTFFGIKEAVDLVITSVRQLKAVMWDIPLGIFAKLAGVKPEAVKPTPPQYGTGVIFGPPKPEAPQPPKDKEFLSDYYEGMFEAAQQQWENIKTLEQNRIDWLYKTGQIDLQQYISFLEQKLAAEEQFSSNWVDIYDTIEQTKEGAVEAEKRRQEEIRKKWLESMEFTRSIYETIGSVAGNTFQTILLSQESATKKMKSIMQGFLSSIVGVLARALSEFIANALLEIAWHKFKETQKTKITAEETAKRSAMSAGGAFGGIGFGISMLGAILPFFQHGGLVHGMGIAEEGEYVLPQRVVESIGVPTLERVKATGSVGGSSVVFDFSGMSFSNTTREDARWISSKIEERVLEIIRDGTLTRRLEI